MTCNMGEYYKRKDIVRIMLEPLDIIATSCHFYNLKIWIILDWIFEENGQPPEVRELDPGQSPRIRDAAVANYWPWLWLRALKSRCAKQKERTEKACIGCCKFHTTDSDTF